MPSRLLVRVALAAVVAGMLHPTRGPARADDAGTVPVGVARVDLTPDGPIRLSGYAARNAESTGVGLPIGAKALAIGGDGQPGPALVLSLDGLGIPAAITDEVARRLEQKTKVDPRRFSIAASHTHAAPCLNGVAWNIFGKELPAEEQARVDAYTRVVTNRLEQVALAALADRRPARLAWNQGTAKFAANRRTPGGPVDHSVPVLRVANPDGSPRAVLVNYACHCTSIDPKVNQVHGDWAGVAQATIEADHPGCTALTVVGCGADSNPAPRGTIAMAEGHGRALAAEVARLLKDTQGWHDLPAAAPEVVARSFTLPFDNWPDRVELEKRAAAGGPKGRAARFWLDANRPTPPELPYQVRAWRFGDRLAMVFLPGEVVVDYVLRLKKELDADRLWVTAYSNDAPCYIPSERILREGGYEAEGAMPYYGWPARLKTGVEDRIIAEVKQAVGAGFDRPAEVNPPLTPVQGAAAWRVRPGLRVELVAAEPLIDSPVAVDFGADGRLWVCEMRDYPLGLDGKGQPGGVVKVLEDRDGDGRYETATPFLEGLPFPTGLMAWRKGVLICAAPEVIYAEDTDGDGRADVRRTLLEGFATENFQARVNGLHLGLDGWVYGANGLIGGTIRGRAGDRAVNIGGRDFRLQPDSGVFEPASGLTQQGRTRDDWGNAFGGNNSVLLQHYPLPDHASRRNPHIAPPAPAVAVVRDDDPNRIFPASRAVERFNHPESANRVTSACSPMFYRDDALGADLAGNAFACEPVHNLVRRMVLRPDGATFAALRAADEADREFLASVDPWCRPVQVRTGPDGALWVVDMYRAVVEHPRWIAPETLKTLDVRAGAGLGRIYRIVPDGKPAPSPVVRLEGQAGPELARAMGSGNGTVRDMIQRLLMHRGDRTAAPALAELARTSPRPEVRVQALATLDLLGSLDAADLARALGDAHPGVRRDAVRVASARLADDPTMVTRVAAAATDDADPSVRFQAALGLGDSARPEAGAALGRMMVRDGGDHWLRAAVLSSAVPHAAAILAAVADAAGPGGPVPAVVEPLIGTIAAIGSPADRALALGRLRVDPAREPEAWRLGALARWLDARRDADLADPALAATLAAARGWAADPDRRIEVRIGSIRLLHRAAADRDRDRVVLAGRLAPGEPAEVQSAAIVALARAGDRAPADAILGAWARLVPTARGEALDALLARAGTAEAVVAALEDGRVAPALVDASRRERLLRGDGKDGLRDRAARAFGPRTTGPRAELAAAAEAAVRDKRGDADRGAAVFARVCAGCHRVGEVGHEVGPDLAALTDTSAPSLVAAILDPNREVDARYAVATAALRDGRVVSGLIAAETASAITLKRQDGAGDVILRADLDDLATSARSLMPEGLEADLPGADLPDLLAFLDRGSFNQKPKSLPGNRPRVVAAAGTGPIRLGADAAEVFGPNLVYESEHGNLGYWHSPADRARWTVHLDRPGSFTLTLLSACDPGMAGNGYEVRVGATTFRGTIPATAGWSDYRGLFVGEVKLPPGDHRVEIRPAGPIRGALADVQALTLHPRGER